MDHLIIENQIKIFPTGSKKQHHREQKISSGLPATPSIFQPGNHGAEARNSRSHVEHY